MKLIPTLLLLLATTTQANAQSLTLTNATVHPSPNDPPIENATLIIKAGLIDQILTEASSTPTTNTETIDLAGKHITAGFWNNHVHYLVDQSIAHNPGALQLFIDNYFLKHGFTTTVDTGSDLRIINRIQLAVTTGQVNGPDIIKIGGSFVPLDGTPFYVSPIRLPELKSPERATALTNEYLDLGVDGIKLFTGSWATIDRLAYISAEAITAVTDAAHNRDALVFAHPSDSRGARLAVENGVDVLAHAFPAELDGPWDKNLPADMVDRDVALIPTLKLFRVDLERLGLPPPLVERLQQNAVDQTAAVQQLGGTILFGTDVGYMKETDTKEEFELMQKAGMGFHHILASLTTNPSELFGRQGQVGKIAPGMTADLVVLDGNPATDIKALGKINMTLKSGRVVYQKQ